MLNQNDSYLIREQLSHESNIEHSERMSLIYDERVIMLVQRLGAKIYKDGDEYCCLYGENIQEGICGFGKNPYLAAVNFYNEFYGLNKQR